MSGTWQSGWATGDVVTAAEFKKGVGAVYDTTLSVAAASIDVTSIPQVYAHLRILTYCRGDTAAGTTGLFLRFNGDAGANYDQQYILGTAAAASSGEQFAAGSLSLSACPAATAAANLFGATETTVHNYANSANNKTILGLDVSKSGVTTGLISLAVRGGGWRSTAAINRVTIFPAAGNLVAGSRVTIYAMGF